MNLYRLLAAAVLACSVAACSSSFSSFPPPSPSQPTAPAITVPPPTTSAPGSPATQIVKYRPWASRDQLLPGIDAEWTKSGSCFSNSSASSASTAYRCEVGNELLDPCFADATSRADEVACPDLTKPDEDAVFVIKLTGQLPAPVPASGTALPWRLDLSNGQTCEIITGAADMLGGKNQTYSCANGNIWGSLDQSSPAWQASYAPSGAPASAITQVAVKDAYE